MNLIHISLLALALTACGALEKKDSDTKDECKKDSANSDKEQCSESVEVGKEVEFSGYVMRAFNITVDGVSFNDTEHFYTRFIPDLVMANDKYKEALADTEISVEGEYGVDKFGSNIKVFIASMAQEGHMFEATTNNQGKFSVKVTASALDETFKARLINRIGLLIKYPDGEQQHYCYLLYGLRENISITENGKPIIFDTYQTQLNTYRCSEVNDSELIIPIATGDSTINPIGDVGTTTDTEGNATSEPYAKVVNKIEINSPLASGEEGDNSLLTASYVTGDGKFYLLKSKVRNTSDGSEYLPLIALSNLSNPSLSQSNIQKPDNTSFNILSWYKTDDYYLSYENGARYSCGSGNIGLCSYSTTDGSFEQTLATNIGTGATTAANIYEASSKLYIVLNNTKKCELDFNASSGYKDCVDAPSSNNLNANVRSVVYHAGSIYSTRQCRNEAI